MYPLRPSRPIWSRAFLKPHVCTELCNTQYEITDNVIRVTYQTGCLYPEKVEPAQIHVSNHTVTTPGAELPYLDVDVPFPTPNVRLWIQYPLRNPVEVEMEFDSTPVRLSHVLRAFDSEYKRIYAEEITRATPRNFVCQHRCTECNDEFYMESHLNDFLHPNTAPEQQCSICFESSGQLFCLRKCGHAYHRACIARWFHTAPQEAEGELQKHNSCPMCRQPIIFCSRCDGRRIVDVPYYGAVPPYRNVEEDEADEFENEWIETDGPYGIHTLYYEDLYVKGIVYTRATNRVQILPYVDVSQN